MKTPSPPRPARSTTARRTPRAASPAGRSVSVRYALGLMSGTSADGIDAALIEARGAGADMRVRYLLHVSRPYGAALRRRLLAVMAPAQTATEELARLHAELGDAFAAAALDAIRAAGPARRPSVIGLAGQTVCHLPRDRKGWTVTLQLGEAARVAARTGVTTISDFRQSDVAAGGQGAPLVPWTDWVLFRDPRISRAIQNIGGIGNVTWIPAGATAEEVVAFDTGPGNMVIDGLMDLLTDGRQRYDRDGARAARGRVLEPMLARWLRHPFFKKGLPRTTGREMFGLPFVRAQLPLLRAASRREEDWLATATAFTARSIAAAYRRFLLSGPAGSGRSPSMEAILCGGGARNGTLVQMLAEALPEVRFRTIDAFGIPSEAKEAVSFAMLALGCLDGAPTNLPQATGARMPAILGRIINY